METVIEVFGYLASGLVALSFLMKSMNKLRFVNMIGAALFVIYSVAIKAWPVALINLFVVGVNIFHLRRSGDGSKAE
ncbi:YgjV family protein [Mobilitalea sibirica]|uniref:YgjV family protein n=1 Tax=Mobilitalea sibirica TaxID=1462919 RepID=A0A8J7HC32_9FIRM|nr:YgjV family protein [Mobilitalea sibirica]MBH1941726.1 YgjV family protein [Mobilitalea sibirica]